MKSFNEWKKWKMAKKDKKAMKKAIKQDHNPLTRPLN